MASFVQPVKPENSSMAGSNASQQPGPKDTWQQSHQGAGEGVPEVTESVLPAGFTHHDDVPVIDHRQLKQGHCTQEGENTQVIVLLILTCFTVLFRQSVCQGRLTQDSKV